LPAKWTALYSAHTIRIPIRVKLAVATATKLMTKRGQRRICLPEFVQRIVSVIGAILYVKHIASGYNAAGHKAALVTTRIRNIALSRLYSRHGTQDKRSRNSTNVQDSAAESAAAAATIRRCDAVNDAIISRGNSTHAPPNSASAAE